MPYTSTAEQQGKKEEDSSPSDDDLIAQETAEAMAVNPKSPQTGLKSPPETPLETPPNPAVNTAPGSVPPVFPGNTVTTPLYTQQLPRDRKVPETVPLCPSTALLYLDLGTKGLKKFKQFTETYGVVYKVGVADGKKLMKTIKKWMIMNQFGHLLLIPLSGTGRLVANSPSTSPVQGFDLSDPRNLVTHSHLIPEVEFESTIWFIFDGTNSVRGGNAKMEINAIDANGSGTHVKLNRWRRKMRMMSYVLLYYLQALIQPTDFDALLVNMDSFLFTDSTTQVNQLCGFLLLYKILQVCSPSTFIDVETLERRSL